MRCPAWRIGRSRSCAARKGIGGEHFFQKHGHGTLPDGVREGEADGRRISRSTTRTA